MPELVPNTLLQNRYRIQRVITSGGSGSVYQALDEELQREVAVKQNGTALPADAFLGEARRLARLRHPNLPRVIEAFQENGQQFCVMDYVDGQNLDDLLSASATKRFGIGEVAPWAVQILDALDYLHSRIPPVIHRDIKPGNLILADDTIVLVDFGFAQGGSPAQPVGGEDDPYAAPEQRSGQATPASDLYSLAATIYHLVTGFPPPEAINRQREVQKGRRDPLAPASLYDPAIGAEVSAVLERALSLAPLQRWGSAAEMRAAFEHALQADAQLGTDHVVAPPDPPERSLPFWLTWIVPVVLGFLLVTCAFFGLQPLLAGRSATATPTPGGSAMAAASSSPSPAAQASAEASPSASTAPTVAAQSPSVAPSDAGSPSPSASPGESAAASPSAAPGESTAPSATASEAPSEAPSPSAPAAIVPPPVPTAGPPNTIRIALQSPFSGEYAAVGTGIRHAAELAILQQNRPVNDLGFHLDFVPYDDRGNPEQGAANAQSIVADPQTLCVVGSYNSGVTLATQPIYGDASLVQISPASTNPQVTDSNDNVWRVVGRDDVQGTVAARYAREQLGSQRAYIIHDNSQYGRGIAQFFQREAQNIGLSVVQLTAFNDTQDNVDWTPFLDEIQALGPDVIYFAGSYTRAGPFFRQARERGIGAQFLGSDTLDSPELASLAGDAVNGMHFTTVAAPVSEFPQAGPFAQSYRESFGTDAPPFSPEAYDATTICIQAIGQAARSTGRYPTRAEVLAAMRRLPLFQGISGNYRFNQNGDPLSVGYYVVEVNAANWGANRIVQGLLAGPP